MTDNSAETGTLWTVLGGIENGQLFWETVWQLLKKLNMEFPDNLAISLLGIYPKERETYVHRDNLCMNAHGDVIQGGWRTGDQARVHQCVMAEQTMMCLYTYH